MIHILALAWKSLANRRFTAALTVMSIALSVTLFIGVERLRSEARASFANTLSGTDLIIGARSSPVQLLLYTVFRIGDATNNISWDSYKHIAAHPKVRWTVPMSLGDSHRGFWVLGTTATYFEHYRYARDRRLDIAQGHEFSGLHDAVIGAEVADKLAYDIGDAIVVAHGTNDVSFARHDDQPFRVVGVIARTGTPVDRTIHIGLDAMEAIHQGWQNAPPGSLNLTRENQAMSLTPTAITGALVGLRSKVSIFGVQRYVNDYSREPLSAILPGVALSQLWNLVAIAENSLLVVSIFVVVVGLFGMLTALLTSLNERRREMAILRSVGARPAHVFALIMGEAGFLTLLGALWGLAMLYLLLFIGQPVVESQFGIFIEIGALSRYECMLLGGVVGIGFAVGSVPAYRAYRLALADGLSVRV